MAMLVLRENDVIMLPRPFTHLLREKSKCSDFAENLHDCRLDIVRHDGDVSFRNYDVITLPRPLAHLLHEKSMCSDCDVAETLSVLMGTMILRDSNVLPVSQPQFQSRA